MNTPLLLTVKQAAHQLSVCPRTVTRMLEKGELPKVKVRGAVRIPAKALAQWVEQSTRLPDNGHRAGPVVRKGESTCHLSVKTASSGGQLLSHRAAKELDDLLERKTARKPPH